MTKLLELALKKLATLPADRQENIAQLILKEIEENIENEPIKDNDSSSLPPSIGMGASGMSDLSTRCKELLWQDER
jgi:homoserine kinase